MAIPGILQQIARNHPMLQNVKQMMGMLNASQNPQAMLNQLLSNNQQLKPVMDSINQAGGDPQKAFYAMAEKLGVNPQDVFDMMK